MSIVHKLDGIPFFAELNDEELAFLTNYLCEKTYEAGEVILHQGSHGGDLYLISSGLVSVHVSLPGDIQREATKLGTGQIFGEVSFLTNDPITASIIAVEKSTFIIFYFKVLAMLRVAYPHMAYKIESAIARLTTDKIVSNINRIRDLLNKVPHVVQQQSKHVVKLPIATATFSDVNIYDLKREFINHLSFFANLQQEDADFLLQHMQAWKYDQGYELSPKDKSTRKISIIYSGAVMLFIKEKQQMKKSIAVIGFGNMFVQNFVAPELNELATYVTCEKSVILEIDYSFYEKLYELNPACFYAISQILHCTVASSVYILNRQFVRINCEYSDLSK